jgi:transcriptional regulator with XRE-family HTH domain
MPARINHEELAVELVRALRGKRSCASASRRAGYRSNVVQRWERKEAWPTAAGFLRFCQGVRVDVAKVYGDFFGRPPEWLERQEPASSEAVAAFLSQMRGKTAINALAHSAGVNRYTMSRWLNGSSEPRLPDFLRLIEVLSRRLVDFLAVLVDPELLPSMKQRWARVRAARSLAYAEPRSHAVLRALELAEYRERGFAEPGFLERRLGMSTSEVQRCLAALQRAGQIRQRQGKWQPVAVLRVDTRADPAGARAAKLAWLDVARERLERGAPGNFGFSLFAISRQDLRRLRELHLEYVRSMQALIAGSRSSECVALYCAQLLDLDVGSHNALGSDEP